MLAATRDGAAVARRAHNPKVGVQIPPRNQTFRPSHPTGRPAPSSWLAPLAGYVHSQILPVELPSAFTLYSKTPAMPFSLANFSELVWKCIAPR